MGKKEKEKKEKLEKKGEEKIAISKSEYETLKAQSKEKELAYDKYLRVRAEFENALKRLEKEREAFLKYANEGLIMEFLPIVDNLEIAEKHTKEAKDFDAVRKGVDMIHGQIQKFLKELGVERIKSVDGKFDPNLHEVVEVLESDDKESGLIVQELKPGYMLSGKLLRPALVKVSKKPTGKERDERETESRGQKSEDRSQKTENTESDL